MPHVHNPKNHNKINVMNLTFVLLKPKCFFFFFKCVGSDKQFFLRWRAPTCPFVVSSLLSQVSKEDINYYARSLSLWL